MTKKKKNVSVIKNGDKLTVRFDPMFYVTAARRETPPPTRVEMPKKGKGSYNRKEKHKRSCHSENDGNSFLYAHKIIYSAGTVNNCFTKSIVNRPLLLSACKLLRF